MKTYISHKRVQAAQIAGIFVGSDTVQTMDGEMHSMPGLFNRAIPDVGDYLVVYEDGYMSHSPKAAFESGYTLVPGEVLHGFDRMLQFFAYQHLPEHLQAHSKPFHDLAQTIIDTLPANAERTTALRKLLEAKDCAVRARLYKEPERTGALTA